MSITLYRKVNGTWTAIAEAASPTKEDWGEAIAPNPDYVGTVRSMAEAQGLTVAFTLVHRGEDEVTQYQDGTGHTDSDGYNLTSLDDATARKLNRALQPYFGGSGSNPHTQRPAFCRMEIQDFWTSFSNTAETH